MANWPSYTIEVLGDRESLRRIVDILLPQTHKEYIKWDCPSNIYDKTDYIQLTLSGYTPFGIIGYKNIANIVKENGLTMRFKEADSLNYILMSKYDMGDCIYSESKLHYNMSEYTDEAWKDYLEVDEAWEMDWENMKSEYLNSLENSRSGKARVGTASDELPF